VADRSYDYANIAEVSGGVAGWDVESAAESAKAAVQVNCWAPKKRAHFICGCSKIFVVA